MSMNDFEKFKSQLGTQNVLIVGDVMIDAYLWGGVDRISPEAPVPVVAETRRENRLGGAANVALNIRALGANPILCTVLGDDAKSHDFEAMMDKADMTSEGILTSATRITTVKYRIIGNNTQLLRVDKEITDPLSAEDEQRLIEKVANLLETKTINAIVFQDYDKGCITPRVIAEITAMAKSRNIPTTVDPKHRNFLNFKDVTLFKPNLKELSEGLGVDAKNADIATLRSAAERLHETQRIDIVFITLSERGAFIADFRSGKAETVLVPAHLRKISDVSGAGDTVISVATLCLSMGLPIETLLNYSNLAGGIVCETVGVVPIDRQRLFDEIQRLYC